jgi:hypothetical protein
MNGGFVQRSGFVVGAEHGAAGEVCRYNNHMKYAPYGRRTAASRRPFM